MKVTHVMSIYVTHVMNFSVVAGLSSYKLVPYSKVKNLVYRNGMPYHVFFKTSFSDNYSQARINKSVKKAASTIVAKPLNTNIPMAACFRAFKDFGIFKNQLIYLINVFIILNKINK